VKKYLRCLETSVLRLPTLAFAEAWDRPMCQEGWEVAVGFEGTFQAALILLHVVLPFY